MSLSSLTIQSDPVPYWSYLSLAEANHLMIVIPGARNTKWIAATDEQKNIYLVSATQRLDLLPWQGKPTGGAAQTTAWPRTGLIYQEDATQVPDDLIPRHLEMATILLAGTIGVDAQHANVAPIQTPGQRPVSSIQAGRVQIEFQNTAQAQRQRLPGERGTPLLSDVTALQWINQWLRGINENIGNSIVFGGFAQGGRADRDRYRDRDRVGW